MRRSSIAICVCLAMMVASSGSAGAATLTPTSANFGSQAVGTVSAPRTFTLTPDLLDLLPLTITTTGDFRQTNTCPAALQFASGGCTINVSFTPKAAGDRPGTLSTTTTVLGGPSATLRGTATQDAKGPDSTQGAACKKKGKGKKKGGKRGKGKKTGAAAAKKKGKGKKKAKGCKKKRGKKKGKRKKK